MAEGKIRIKDIAKIAGVSATTVSNVIHGRTEKVSRKRPTGVLLKPPSISRSISWNRFLLPTTLNTMPGIVSCAANYMHRVNPVHL